MTEPETQSFVDDSTRTHVETLLARSASVLQEFGAISSSRVSHVEDLVALTDALAAENDELRQALAESEDVSRDSKRKMSLFVAEAGELAHHHKRVVGILSEVLDAVTERMRDQKDEDKRIEAAREIAFSRARFGIGEPAGAANGLFHERGAEVGPEPAGHVEESSQYVVDGEDLNRELARTMSGFARVGNGR